MAYIDNVNKVLNIQPEAAPTRVRLSQNENGRNLYFTLAGNENPIPSGVTVTISGTKPDGTVYSGIGSISNDVVLIPETVQLTAVAGVWDAKVKITSGGNTVATGRIRFLIDADTVAPGSVPSSSVLEGLVEQAQQYAETSRQEAYGSPLTATTVAGMTDHTRVYVYTGSESGKTAGHWYYWNGSAWTDGGVYNSTAVQTDKTLSLMDVPADAKAVGDAIATDKTLSIADAPADAQTVGLKFSYIRGMIAGVETTTIATKDYSIGDLIVVRENETLYEATKAITTGTEIKSVNAKVTTIDEAISSRIMSSIDSSLTQTGKAADAKVVGDELDSLKGDFTRFSNYASVEFVDGGFITTSGNSVDISSVTPSNSYQYAVIPCVEGDKLIINANGAQGARPWCLIKSDGTPIYRASTSNLIASDLELIAPAGCAYAIINNNKTRNPNAACFKGYTVADVQSQMTHDMNVISGCTNIRFIYGYYINTNGSAVDIDNPIMYSTWAYAKTECTAGDVFYVKGYGGSNGRLWCFIDANGAVLSAAETNLHTDVLIPITAPTGAAFVIVNSRYNMIDGVCLKGVPFSAKTQAIMERGHVYGYVNCIKPLDLTNPYGTTQNVHPKVIYIADGFGGHNWWMTYTPYTYANTKQENPCIAYSDDGINWTNIGNNPIDVPDDGTNGYFSDTHLVFNGSTLECWYRLADKGNMNEVIYRKTSTDGITWSAREKLHETGTETSLSRCLCPVAIWDGSKYMIWFVYYKGRVVDKDNIYIQYCESINGSDWQDIRTIKLDYIDTNGLAYRLWHIDVELIDGQYNLIAMCKGGDANNDDDGVLQEWSLFYAISNDNINYSRPKILMYGSDKWDRYMYRSSVIKVDGIVYLYYSALDESKAHYMAIAKGKSINKLFAIDILG